MAPSCGGRVEGTRLHQLHVEDLLSRDPELTLLAARTAWRNWRPGGNGMTYRVKICRIEGGLADCDKILLVNIGVRTWSFQYQVTAERRATAKLNGAWQVPLSRGVPERVWTDVLPLLQILLAV